ncbi:MAG TPA: hypothetical protein VFC78_05235, partial [Tepidisphaeraceae bacterium]|nr:hypothetical protein [Tepidisphaeraceae bacterium]
MTRIRYRLASGLFLPALSVGTLLLAGCGHEHHQDQPQSVVLMDDSGFRHEGYYDQSHGWHGGYYDERHAYHPDAHDWHASAKREAPRQPAHD